MANDDRLPAQSEMFRGTLYDTMNEDLQLAGMSKRTVHGYLRAVRHLANWAERSPGKTTETMGIRIH